MSFNVQASTYPTVIPNDLFINAKVGSTVNIGYYYYGEYKNERLDLYIYDKAGEEVYSKSKSFSSYYNEGGKDISFLWNTDGLPAGDYTVELHKFFYSYFEWHEAPTTEKCYITLKAMPKKITKGTTFISGRMEYKVTSINGKAGTAAVIGLSNGGYTYVNIPAKVKTKGITFKITSIAKDAFDFSSLKKVVIGSNVETIGSEAFYYSDQLKNIIFKTKKLRKVGARAFTDLPTKVAVTIPRSVYSKYVILLKNKGFSPSVTYKKR